MSQDVKRQYATCFVARDFTTDRVAGFYTLSASTVPLSDVPAALAKKLPRYPTGPAVLLEWLGRDLTFARFGLGRALVFDAIQRIAAAPIGTHAIFAEAIDEAAVTFYTGLGFVPLVSRPMTLYLPVASALRLVPSP